MRVMTARAQQFEKWLREHCKNYIGGQAEKIISEKICDGDVFELGATETKSGTPKTFQF